MFDEDHKEQSAYQDPRNHGNTGISISNSVDRASLDAVTDAIMRILQSQQSDQVILEALSTLDTFADSMVGPVNVSGCTADFSSRE